MYSSILCLLTPIEKIGITHYNRHLLDYYCLIIILPLTILQNQHLVIAYTEEVPYWTISTMPTCYILDSSPQPFRYKSLALSCMS